MSETEKKAGKKYSLSSPLQHLASATIKNFEKISAMQLASTKVYSDIGFSQLRKMAQLGDMDDMRDFAWDQLGPMSEVNKQMLADWKQWVAINNEYKSDIKAALRTVKNTPQESSPEVAGEASGTAKAEKPPKAATEKKTSTKKTTAKATPKKRAPAKRSSATKSASNSKNSTTAKTQKSASSTKPKLVEVDNRKSEDPTKPNSEMVQSLLTP